MRRWVGGGESSGCCPPSLLWLRGSAASLCVATQKVRLCRARGQRRLPPHSLTTLSTLHLHLHPRSSATSSAFHLTAPRPEISAPLPTCSLLSATLARRSPPLAGFQVAGALSCDVGVHFAAQCLPAGAGPGRPVFGARPLPPPAAAVLHLRRRRRYPRLVRRVQSAEELRLHQAPPARGHPPGTHRPPTAELCRPTPPPRLQSPEIRTSGRRRGTATATPPPWPPLPAVAVRPRRSPALGRALPRTRAGGR